MRRERDGVSVDIVVTPRASRSRIGPILGDRLKVAVTAAPVRGAANRAIVELFAKKLRVARRAVAVTAGLSSRRKTIRIAGIEPAAVEGLIE